MSAFQYLQIEHSPSDQVIELLENNVIGSPGKSMLYRHKNVKAKIDSTSNPVFANLSIRDRLYGTICLSKRRVFNLGSAKDAYYLRYFTFRDEFRSTNPKEANQRNSKIRDEVAKLMNGEGLDCEGELLLYAYVDKENFRSKRLIDEFGFRKVGEFNVIPFSRLNPKCNHRVSRIEKTEQALMTQLLRKYHSEQQLVSFDHLFSGGDYFLIKNNDGEITCGVQAITDGWKIIDLPGVSGRFMMKVVPRLPFLGKLFNPDYRFIFFEYLYCKQGSEKDLDRLLESVLNILNMNSAVICLDPASKLYAQIQNLKLGVTHMIIGENNIDIVAKSSNVSFLNKQAPFFVSGFDVL